MSTCGIDPDARRVQERVRELEEQARTLTTERDAAEARVAELEQALNEENAAYNGANKHIAELEASIETVRVASIEEYGPSALPKRVCRVCWAIKPGPCYPYCWLATALGRPR